jgi:hypothetical protein
VLEERRAGDQVSLKAGRGRLHYECPFVPKAAIFIKSSFLPQRSRFEAYELG